MFVLVPSLHSRQREEKSSCPENLENFYQILERLMHTRALSDRAYAYMPMVGERAFSFPSVSGN